MLRSSNPQGKYFWNLAPAQPAVSYRYNIGRGFDSFSDAMEHCNKLGCYSVHINSQTEHEHIKGIIKSYDTGNNF